MKYIQGSYFPEIYLHVGEADHILDISKHYEDNKANEWDKGDMRYSG